jgi:fumarylacetoacetate (FAA) hydrolase
MKLGSLEDGTRDGCLVVVSRDLTYAVKPEAIAHTLLEAMENWDRCAAALQGIYEELNRGHSPRAFQLDETRLAAPLPRAPQWLDASAFHSHGDLMEKVLGLEPIEGKLEFPLMYQGASDDFLGAHDEMPLPSEAHGIDFEAEIAVIVDRVPMGASSANARDHIKLVLLANDASLRALARREIRTGFGFLQSKPATSFSPVAVSPDELGEAWREGRVHLPVRVHWKGEWFGQPDGGQMGFGFHELIAYAAATRNLHAGTIIGSGTVSNAEYRTVGSGCIAERRGIESLDKGEPRTSYMKFGDRVRIEMIDEGGCSIFGAIDQRVIEAK